MAISKISTKGMSGDTLDAGDIAPNAIGASELADNAVDTAAIAANAVTTAKITNLNVTAAKFSSTALASVEHVKPHIQPDVLYPAVEGNDLDGTDIDTSHGSTYTYGTAHADGRKYYYTDIKGSKPIKDPRIGSHFGSQRHNIDSMQLLEQETATHGKNVYSMDGREWMRAIQGSGQTLEIQNNSNGNRVVGNGADVALEFTGYFRDVNYIGQTYASDNRSFTVTLDGTTGSEVNTFNASTTPLGSRHVDAGSVVNLGLSTTLGIHTIKIQCHSSSDWLNFHGIELIAQDTSNRNNIQIPSQNVVSYGKKFTVSGTPHYDPFNGFTNGTTLHSAVVDTATSLGLSSAPGSSASWAISGSNNIRPYNGGRVVKWVDSSGVIKTSVNMMPPNAQNFGTTAAAEITTPSATNTAYLPAFSDDAIDDSLSEVAKTFHWREFGNGSANGGTGATYADASMLKDDDDDIAYVMDDGLTSLSGNDVKEASTMIYRTGNSSHHYITFIGTGVSKAGGQSGTAASEATIAQNLPYGTHILKHSLNGSSTVNADLTIDGVVVSSNIVNDHLGLQEITFHQPKMPPIPEDAVVIADYMLMADYVKQTAADGVKISKGIRLLSTSRDVVADTSGTFPAVSVSVPYPPFNFVGIHTSSNVATGGTKVEVSVFASQCEIRAYAGRGNIFVDGSDVADSDVGTGATSVTTQDTASTLGVHTVGAKNNASNNLNCVAIGIVSPIHTSSHYQTFETPFLHELVGGDRNMEQTNLVVTPDGKTWDEVTRDTSYIGNLCIQTTTDTTSTTSGTVQLFDEWRGTLAYKNWKNKDFAIAYDRMICLKGGEYTIHSHTIRNGTMEHCRIYINGTQVMNAHGGSDNHDTPNTNLTLVLKRGDYIQSLGGWYPSLHYSYFQVTRN